jgi:hypothetical protein
VKSMVSSSVISEEERQYEDNLSEVIEEAK